MELHYSTSPMLQNNGHKAIEEHLFDEFLLQIHQLREEKKIPLDKTIDTLQQPSMMDQLNQMGQMFQQESGRAGASSQSTPVIPGTSIEQAVSYCTLHSPNS